jgi:hypothetical protein
VGLLLSVGQALMSVGPGSKVQSQPRCSHWPVLVYYFNLGAAHWGCAPNCTFYTHYDSHYSFKYFINFTSCWWGLKSSLQLHCQVTNQESHIRIVAVTTALDHISTALQLPHCTGRNLKLFYQGIITTALLLINTEGKSSTSQ